MKVLVKEVEVEGLAALLGKRVTLMCANYFYTGELVGVNESCVKLRDAGIVYETGSFAEKDWKDYQPFPAGTEWYVQLAMIESYGVLK